MAFMKFDHNPLDNAIWVILGNKQMQFLIQISFWGGME